VAIFQVKPTGLEAVSETTFGAEGIFERKHIQKLLREQIAVLDGTLLVIAEEFGDWLDSSRRIDLLCLDRSARLVVVELRRTEDGGHMEI
jgi:RecB family endonuclease NucS